MSYAAALDKAWECLESGPLFDERPVRFFGETYIVRRRAREVQSSSTGAPAREYAVILILHYLCKALEGAYSPGESWVSFREIEGGEFYYPAFREGSIAPILKKYGDSPEGIIGALGRFRGRRIEGGDAAIEVEVFPEVFVRVILWKGDEEFGPDATMLFEGNISSLFSMEDVAVLSRIVAQGL